MNNAAVFGLIAVVARVLQQTTEPTSPPPVISIDSGGLTAILLGLAASIVGLLVWFMRSRLELANRGRAVEIERKEKETDFSAKASDLALTTAAQAATDNRDLNNKLYALNEKMHDANLEAEKRFNALNTKFMEQTIELSVLRPLPALVGDLQKEVAGQAKENVGLTAQVLELRAQITELQKQVRDLTEQLRQSRAENVELKAEAASGGSSGRSTPATSSAAGAAAATSGASSGASSGKSGSSTSGSAQSEGTEFLVTELPKEKSA